ncbi:substrate-binding domain-containing protein [Mycobacterium sp. KBS0706]|uniref:substrate-binding domain-containing protein n=1 Tax=Mycobacterium sp. KBS0706 TaxID=2578109 RepID=UPI00110F9521|nr:substrate-binding domain-containing protein [Mycobacterium sp. KBS0706]TSD89874.1 substrate-binding domain-containing protein [Mycobacterium sp. KBS0706]
MAGVHQSGVEVLLGVVDRLIETPGGAAVAVLAEDLAVPRSSLYAVLRPMLAAGWLEAPRRGAVRLGAAWFDLAVALEAESQAAPSRPRLRGTTGPARSFLWNPGFTELVDAAPFARQPPHVLGFSNGSRANLWRQGLIHGVQFAAAEQADRVAALRIAHADDDPAAQARDIDAFLAMGVDALIVSPLETEALLPPLARACAAGLPVVMVDRLLGDTAHSLVQVAGPDTAIGRLPAQWLVETLGGRGGLVMMVGDPEIGPLLRRARAAREVFALAPGIRILDTVCTELTVAAGRRAMAALIGRWGDAIDGIWCDSGLHGAGSIQAWVDAGRDGRVPPHTGGDQNAVYQLAILHGVKLAAMDFPPAMGIRAVEAALDILAGRTLPRRIEVHTPLVISRGCETASVRADIFVEDHVRWDRPPSLVLGHGMGEDYDPTTFAVGKRAAAEGGARSILRTLDILVWLKAHGGEAGIADLLEAVAMPRSSLHDLLGPLAGQGLLQRGGRGRIRAGPRARAAGFAAIGIADLAAMAEPILDRLARSTGGAAALAVLHGERCTIALGRAAPGMPPIAVGCRTPVNWTLAGRLLVAELPERRMRWLLAAHARPRRDASLTLPELVAAIRAQGGQRVAALAGEAGPDLGEAARPIRGADGQVRAVLLLRVPATDLPAARAALESLDLPDTAASVLPTDPPPVTEAVLP